MAIKIGHASIDERGKISGGKAGDQTGKEICTRSWYSKPWNVYLECLDPALADKAAQYMEQICTDPNYGYDQIERWTGYANIKKNNKKVKGAKGEFDCSSLVITCYILAGLSMSADGYTGNLRAKLLATGKFKAYTDAPHLTSDKYAKRGGIYLAEGHHVVMALGQINPYKEPTETIHKGTAGDGVKWVQWELREAGFNIEIDGSCGPKTDKAIRTYQQSCKITVDGRVGPKTRQALARTDPIKPLDMKRNAIGLAPEQSGAFCN